MWFVTDYRRIKSEERAVLEIWMASKAIDLYTVELELLEDPVDSVHPVRCVATNTDDQSTPEISLSVDGTRAVVAHAYGDEPGAIEECMQQLQDHNYVQLVAQYRGAKADLCIFTSKELVTLGFNPDDVRQ
jgi:hypothetical protein